MHWSKAPDSFGARVVRLPPRPKDRATYGFCLGVSDMLYSLFDRGPHSDMDLFLSYFGTFWSIASMSTNYSSTHRIFVVLGWAEVTTQDLPPAFKIVSTRIDPACFNQTSRFLLRGLEMVVIYLIFDSPYICINVCGHIHIYIYIHTYICIVYIIWACFISCGKLFLFKLPTSLQVPAALSRRTFQPLLWWLGGSLRGRICPFFQKLRLPSW